MLIDKKKAEKGKWRIQEKTIFIITALNQRKARNMRKWQKYFIVSIEELERSREY